MSSPLGMIKGWQKLGERWLRGIDGHVGWKPRRGVNTRWSCLPHTSSHIYSFRVTCLPFCSSNSEGLPITGTHSLPTKRAWHFSNQAGHSVMHKLSDAGRKFSFPIEMASVILAQSHQLIPCPREETSLQRARMRLKKNQKGGGGMKEERGDGGGDDSGDIIWVPGPHHSWPAPYLNSFIKTNIFLFLT